MSVPTRIVLERSYNTVFLAYNQDITRLVGATPWGTGFTLTVNAAPVAITSAVKVANGIWFGTGSSFLDTDTVAIAYAGTNIVDAATSLSVVPTFLSTAAPLFWDSGATIPAAVISTATPTQIVITFRDPVASLTGDLKADLTLSVNSVPVSLATATVVGTGRVVTVTMLSDFSYSDVVSLTYTPGDWYYVETNALVSGFTLAVVTNASEIGTQASNYPLSCIITEPLVISGNTVTATITVSLSFVDRELAIRYLPTFDQGGTFGLPTVTPPTGYSVSTLLQLVRDGQIYTYPFTVVGNTLWASIAANDWLAQMTSRIGVALNTARATDQSITFGTRTITQV